MYTTNNNFLNIFQLICSYWLGTCYPNNSFVASKTTKISWFTNFLLNNSFIVLKTFNWEKFCWLTIKYWFSQQKVNIKKLTADILLKTFVYYEYFDSSDVLNVLNKKQKIRKNRSLNLLNSFCHYIFKTLCNMYCMQPAFLRRIDWNWLNKDHITGS